MNKLLLLVLSITMISCTAEPIEIKPNGMTYEEATNLPTHTFTVVWYSNQEEPYVEFIKYVFKDCEEIDRTTEVHRENRFNITLRQGQVFDIQIKRQSSVKNPELYLAIYKGDELQYEQEVNTGGFLMSNHVDYNGNISK